MNEDKDRVTKLKQHIEKLQPANDLKKGAGKSNLARVSVEFAAVIIVGILIGHNLDKYFNTKPILLIICFILGMISGIYNLIKIVRSIDE